MLRISKLTDYAVVVASELAAVYRDGEEVTVNAKELSAETHIPEPTVSKVLKQLVRTRIAVSHRGARGGYRLARDPELVSVAEVVRAIEGPLNITECSDPYDPGSCEMAASCEMRPGWQRIHLAIEGALRAVSLAEMARRPGSELVPLKRAAVSARVLDAAPSTGRPVEPPAVERAASIRRTGPASARAGDPRAEDASAVQASAETAATTQRTDALAELCVAAGTKPSPSQSPPPQGPPAASLPERT